MGKTSPVIASRVIPQFADVPPFANVALDCNALTTLYADRKPSEFVPPTLEIAASDENVEISPPLAAPGADINDNKTQSALEVDTPVTVGVVAEPVTLVTEVGSEALGSHGLVKREASTPATA